VLVNANASAAGRKSLHKLVLHGIICIEYLVFLVSLQLLKRHFAAGAGFPG